MIKNLGGSAKRLTNGLIWIDVISDCRFEVFLRIFVLQIAGMQGVSERTDPQQMEKALIYLHRSLQADLSR